MVEVNNGGYLEGASSYFYCRILEIEEAEEGENQIAAY